MEVINNNPLTLAANDHEPKLAENRINIIRTKVSMDPHTVTVATIVQDVK